MELQTISQVSKDYGISKRMLRYYEQAVDAYAIWLMARRCGLTGLD